MILAVDVDYKNNEANIAGILFDSWDDEVPKRTFKYNIKNVADYEAGSFYKRELPCILKLINESQLEPDVIIIDGFVYLDNDMKPGLGKHLFDALASKSTVIGVAKSSFHGISQEHELIRGDSKKPLYITSAGIDKISAKKYVSEMHGPYRLPTLLKLVDSECRKWESH
jgi:deoxyribonuclease V